MFVKYDVYFASSAKVKWSAIFSDGRLYVYVTCDSWMTSSASVVTGCRQCSFIVDHHECDSVRRWRTYAEMAILFRQQQHFVVVLGGGLMKTESENE